MKLSLGVRTSNVTIANACWEIRTGSTPGRVKVFEIGITLAAATASTFGLGRPAAIGVTPTSPIDFQVEDPNDVLATGVIQSALAWGTGPTVPANYLRRFTLPATVGTGIIWTFPEGLVIPVSSSLIIWNISATGVADMYAVVGI